MIKVGSRVKARDGMEGDRIGTIAMISEFEVGQETDYIALVIWDDVDYATAINVLNLVEVE